MADLTMGNYVDLLDAGLYVTGIVEKRARWRINDNLLHTVEFSPMLRRTDKVNAATDAALNARCEDFMGEVPPEIFQRALRYLYARETRTSYAIEQEKPTAQRMERFMALLGKAGSEDYLTERKHAYFLKLTDAEVSALEQAIRNAYHLDGGGGPGEGEET